MLHTNSVPKTRTKESFFDRIYRKNNSQKSVNHAQISLKHFERYCEKAYHKNAYEVIAEIKADTKKDPLVVYNFLEDLVDYLISIEKKNGQVIAIPTVIGYLNGSKQFLRYMGILVDNGIVSQYVAIPKQFKELKKPVKIEELQLLIENAKPLRKAMYLTLLSSGMRLGEILQLTKSDFDLTKDPVRITIPAKIAKNRHSRIAFISKEARSKLEPILLNIENDDLVFTSSKDPERAELTEDQSFARLRVKCKLDDYDAGKRRHRITIHKFRKWFTSTVVKNGMIPEYKNTLTGWSSFDETYHEFDIEDLTEAYRKIEPNLYITTEYQAKSQVKEKDKQLAKIKEHETTIADIQSHVDKMEENLNKKIQELSETKVEKLFQKLELDIRKANPRLAKEIINEDWEHAVNNEKVKTLFSYMEILLEDDGGLEGALQGKDYEKFLKEIPKVLKKDKKLS